jgi:hypothetical protein
MQPHLPFDDDAVFARTRAGQRAALYGSRLLDDEQTRFLLLVNGCTPLRTLVDLAGNRDVSATIRKLVLSGLIAPTASPDRP